MAHLIFNSPYEFYNLPEEERIRLIGRVYKERRWILKGSKKKLTYTDKVLDTIYIPIGLHPTEHNYGVQQGVIRITPIMLHFVDKTKFFMVGVFSPDDLDLNLTIGEEHTHLRQEIIAFVKGPMHKQNRRYKEVLEQIRDKFGAGVIS